MFDGGDLFFVEIGIDELVADLELLGGTEAPFIGSADEHGVFKGEFESTVDDIETVVCAEGDLADGRLRCAGIFEACG